MTKEELIKKVAELETKLSNNKYRVQDILDTATNILKGKDNNTPFGRNSIDNIENINELFYEIWKLVSFRDETNNRINYERQQVSYQNEVDFLKNELNKIKNA